MQIFIDGVDFWNGFQPMKYWVHPKSYDVKRKREEARSMVFGGLYLGSRKVDGIWQMIIKDNDGNFHARSRTESVNGGFADKASWIPDICKDLSAIPNGTVLLGELYFPNNEGSRKVTSVFNCLKEKCLDRQAKNGNLHFYVFDILAWNGKSLINTPFEKRVGEGNSFLVNFEACYTQDMNYVEVAEYVRGEELWNLYNETIAAGGEGIVITKDDCKYLCGKRTARATLKMKRELEETIDAFYDGHYKEATRLYSGQEPESWTYWINSKTGERRNVCMYPEYSRGEAWEPVTKSYFYNLPSAISFSILKDGRSFHIAWISSITEEVRCGVVENPDEWIGRVAELTAMQIERISGNFSLRHARILQWRDDKTAADCLYSQIE